MRKYLNYGLLSRKESVAVYRTWQKMKNWLSTSFVVFALISSSSFLPKGMFWHFFISYSIIINFPGNITKWAEQNFHFIIGFTIIKEQSKIVVLDWCLFKGNVVKSKQINERKINKLTPKILQINFSFSFTLFSLGDAVCFSVGELRRREQN